MNRVGGEFPMREHLHFDLKGSTVGRQTSTKEQLGKSDLDLTFKDKDFLERNMVLELGATMKQEVG
jgi:hypothetical protein